ncbi:MAG TPA: cardiolipin synthase [Thermoanaerobaculia bacterium]|nr:cardiolipin synthase [Thermoanaerobaculia bacterium]
MHPRDNSEVTWLPWLITAIQILGILSAIRAVMDARTPQGASAWAIALIAFPYVALPLFWVFGKRKFEGYVIERRSAQAESSPIVAQARQALIERHLLVTTDHTRQLPFERLAKMPFTTGNDAELLINGEATYASIFDGIAAARDYVLVEFYIFRDDGIGRKLQERLLERAAAGVRVYFLYDEIGSHSLPRSFVRRMREGGIQVQSFHTVGGRANRLQLNFRNHRKIVVVDGKHAWAGGINVGDEYLGLDPKVGFWRDTHVHIQGPAVQAVQVAFLEDWCWAAGELLKLNWDPQPSPTGARRKILALPSGPADDLETCTLFFVAVINAATSRLWIASPYFVPDEQFITAVQLAALRGVDVKILVPKKSDNLLVGLSIWSYLEELESVGVEFYQYTRGFMHQKVTLVDDRACTIGTANFDNRSFRLNFEITIAIGDEQTAARVREMLEEDFASATRITLADLHAKSFAFRFAAQAARLASPVQ